MEAADQVHLDQIVRLFVTEDTSCLHSRQLSVLKRVLRGRSDGWYYAELPSLCELLPLIQERAATEGGVFRWIFLELVRLCFLPTLRSKSSEDRLPTSLQALSQLYASLCSMLDDDDVELHDAIVRGFLSLLTAKRGAASSLNEQRPALRDVTQNLMMGAGIIEMVSGRLLQDALNGIAQVEGWNSEHALADAAPKAPAAPYRTLAMGILDLICELSKSPGPSATMVEAGVVKSLVRSLNVRSGTLDPLLSRSTEVLWNLLEQSQFLLDPRIPCSGRSELLWRSRAANAAYALSTHEEVEQLRNTLEVLLMQGFRARDKELRNELLIVIALVAQNVRSHEHFRSTGLLSLLLRHATAAETGMSDDGSLAPPRSFATAESADLEMKRLVWSLLAVLSRQSQENQAVLEQSPIMETLLMYVSLEVEEPEMPTGGLTTSSLSSTGILAGSTRTLSLRCSFESDSPALGGAKLTVPDFLKRLPPTSLRSLQSQAMNALLSLAPRAPSKFHSLKGHEVVLLALERFSGASAECSRLVQGAVSLLVTVVELPGVQEDLGKAGAIRTLIDRFAQDSGRGVSDRQSPDSKADSAIILSRLCRGSCANQDIFRDNGGVELLVHCIQDYCAERALFLKKKKTSGANASALDTLRERQALESGEGAFDAIHPLVVCVLGCIWDAVVGNKKSEGHLLDCEGLDMLFALLEVGPPMMRFQVIGLIADILSNAAAVPYAVTWRSSRDLISLTQLMLRLWTEEERRLGDQRPNGVLRSLKDPLAPSSSEDDMLREEEGENSSPEACETPPRSKRLGAALEAGRAPSAGNNGDIAAFNLAVASLDLKPKIFSVLATLMEHSPEGDQGTLSPQERMTLAMVRRYIDFRQGQAWMAVQNQLQTLGVKPIAADGHLLQSHLDAALSVATRILGEQQMLLKEQEELQSTEEKKFFDSILIRRDQESKQKLLSRTQKPKGKSGRNHMNGGPRARAATVMLKASAG
jgi:hypothetical protein